MDDSTDMDKIRDVFCGKLKAQGILESDTKFIQLRQIQDADYLLDEAIVNRLGAVIKNVSYVPSELDLKYLADRFNRVPGFTSEAFDKIYGKTLDERDERVEAFRVTLGTLLDQAIQEVFPEKKIGKTAVERLTKKDPHSPEQYLIG